MGEISLSTEFLPCFKSNGHLQPFARAYSEKTSVLKKNHPLNVMVRNKIIEVFFQHTLKKLVFKKKSPT